MPGGAVYLAKLGAPPMIDPASTAAHVVVPTRDLPADLDFFAALGFRLDQITPADDPETAILSRHGLRLRLDRLAPCAAITLALPRSTDEDMPPRAPGGAAIEWLRPHDASLPAAPPDAAVALSPPASEWVTGRAGMQYRDLLPDRLGGRAIASHIRIAQAGPVPDFVHYHRVHFQIIACVRGWVRVVYQDQGPPFELRPGDVVLQPPGIRHRVLECSAGLEVLEIGCPARHDTFVDHELELPTDAVDPSKTYGGQRFVRYIAEQDAPEWRSWTSPGLEARSAGIRAAMAQTEGAGAGDVIAIRAAREAVPAAATANPPGPLHRYYFVARGSVRATWGDGQARLGSCSGLFCPGQVALAWDEPSADLLLWEVQLP